LSNQARLREYEHEWIELGSSMNYEWQSPRSY
jgi:hypothetical protein